MVERAFHGTFHRRAHFLSGLQYITIRYDRGIVISENQMYLLGECKPVFEYLEEQVDASLDGIFCSQVIEHLSPAKLPELVLAELCPGLTLNRAAMTRIAAEIEKAGKTKPKKVGKK